MSFGYFLLVRKSTAKKLLPAGLLIIFIILFAFVKYIDSQPDRQCLIPHKVSYTPPSSLITAMDYFNQGNFDYDSGNCTKAISDYTQSLNLDPNSPQSYNNRGYTYMRMHSYASALEDFNKAIELKPDYVEALMNRGDLYNYYGPSIDRQKAIEDYNQVIFLGKDKDLSKSVCGHKAMAENNDVLPLVFLRFLTNTDCSSPSAPKKDLTANWKVYSDSFAGYSFKYPGDYLPYFSKGDNRVGAVASINQIAAERIYQRDMAVVNIPHHLQL